MLLPREILTSSNFIVHGKNDFLDEQYFYTAASHLMFIQVTALHSHVAFGASDLQTNRLVSPSEHNDTMSCSVYIFHIVECLHQSVLLLSVLLQVLFGNRLLAVRTHAQEASAVHLVQGKVGLGHVPVAAREGEPIKASCRRISDSAIWVSF